MCGARRGSAGWGVLRTRPVFAHVSVSARRPGEPAEVVRPGAPLGPRGLGARRARTGGERGGTKNTYFYTIRLLSLSSFALPPRIRGHPRPRLTSRAPRRPQCFSDTFLGGRGPSASPPQSRRRDRRLLKPPPPRHSGGSPSPLAALQWACGNRGPRRWSGGWDPHAGGRASSKTGEE